MLLDPRLPSRFWDKVIPEPNTGCWFWLGGLDRDGYGSYGGSTGGKKYSHRAHRVSYTTLVRPIPLATPEIDHKCRNKCCVNPAHLEPVTRQENATRRRLAKTHCKRGHLFTDSNTRWKGGARSCKDCQRITSRELDKKRSCGWERQRRARKVAESSTSNG